jgi:hypothetical protein
VELGNYSSAEIRILHRAVPQTAGGLLAAETPIAIQWQMRRRKLTFSLRFLFCPTVAPRQTNVTRVGQDPAQEH